MYAVSKSRPSISLAVTFAAVTVLACSIRLGAHAEYLAIPETYPNLFTLEKVTYEAAATIATGGINAMQFINKSKITPGERVLINGAGGSIGIYALQFAKSRGALVTCVDSTSKLPILRELGADDVIDYAQEDFTRNGKSYDVIIDVVGKSSFSRSVKSLNANGRYVLSNSTVTGMLRGIFTSFATYKRVVFQLAAYRKEAFEFIRKQIEDGMIKPVIDKAFPLDQIAEAHRYVEGGLKTGNVVICVDHHE